MTDTSQLDERDRELKQLRFELEEARRERAGMQHLAQKNRAEVDRLRTRDEAMRALVRAAEKACAVIERVLNADASEGTPIWEWPEDEVDLEVREVLAAGDELAAAIDAGALVQLMDEEES